MCRFAVLIVLLTLTIGACRRTRNSGGAAEQRVNILLISLDTTRADHLACYGHPITKTPNIDRLAAQGVRFEQCVSPAPITLPAHASLLTGVYPFVHGARNNTQFHLSDDHETLTEVLKAAGYATRAQVAARVLDREFGLAQGFDAYEDTSVRPGHPSERSAADITDAAIAQLRDLRDKPFFLFLHYYDPHAPYTPPQPFASQYADAYTAEIAAVDAQIGRLLAEMDRLGLTDRTLIVLTADHGEGLGEHGEPTHTTFIYDSTLLVPLIMRLPSHIPAGRIVPEQVRLNDVAPTILALLDLPPLSAAQGISLVEALRGAALPSLPAYAESLHARLNFGACTLRAWRSEGWKYIHATRPELYNLVSDPKELTNLADAEPKRLAEMRAALKTQIAEGSRGQAARSRHRPTGDTAKAIEGLGYIGGGEDEDEEIRARSGEIALFDPVGPDPKDLIDYMNRTAAAIGLHQQGQYALAERELRRLLMEARTDRRSAFRVLKTLGATLGAQGKYEQAAAAFREALTACPDDADTLTELGMTLLRMRNHDAAIDVLRKAISLPPPSARSFFNLAEALAAKGRKQDAIVAYRQGLELDPSQADIRAKLAALHLSIGQREEAVREYREAARLAPQNGAYRRALEELTR